jgi:probable F420-dependent oxidoreductase
MPIRVGLGLGEFPFSGAAAFWRWVALCEEGGVDSLWQTDRLNGPAPFLDCMSVMGALAGATKRMKFGMNVLALGFREPLGVAKGCATIDYLSGGRLLPAFGIGSLTSTDWAATGLSTAGQGARTDEALEIITRLWRGETVDFHGQHFQCKGASIAPLPVQQPLPLWLGGSSPAAIRRTARFGTGWQAGAETPETVGAVVEAIKTAAVEAGRPMDPEHFSAGLFYRFGRGDDPAVERRRAAFGKAFPGRDVERSFVVGGADEIISRLDEFEAAGISKFILRPMGGDDDDRFAQTRRLIDEVLPRVHGKPARA